MYIKRNIDDFLRKTFPRTFLNAYPEAKCFGVEDPASALHGLEYNTRLMTDAIKVGASECFAARIQSARFAKDVPDAAKVKGNVLFRGCRFDNARQASIHAYSKDADTFRVDIADCAISGAIPAACSAPK